jgi:hypothetical protein
MRFLAALSAVLILSISCSFAQSDYQIAFTHGVPGWNQFQEGNTSNFTLSISGNHDDRVFKMAISQGKQIGMELPSLGRG